MLITTFAPSASPKYTATVAPRSQESAGGPGPQDLLSLGSSPAPSLEKSSAPAPQAARAASEPAAPAPSAPSPASSNPTSLLMETPALFSVQPNEDDPDPHHVNQRVRQVVKDNLKGVKDEQLTPECSYVDDLGADSLDQVELLMGFENEFGIKIAEEDAQKLTTIGATVEYVQAHYPADGE